MRSEMYMKLLQAVQDLMKDREHGDIPFHPDHPSMPRAREFQKCSLFFSLFQ